MPENMKGNKLRVIIVTVCLLLLPSLPHAQDTIRLTTKPKAILKSWYPEFKELPTLKVGKSKIVFILIPELERTAIRDNDIDLKTSNSQVKIEETNKTNQYLITVSSNNAGYIEFELWFELGKDIVLLNQNGTWKNIRDIYPKKNDRVLIDTIKLKLVE